MQIVDLNHSLITEIAKSKGVKDSAFIESLLNGLDSVVLIFVNNRLTEEINHHLDQHREDDYGDDYDNR
jgi:hypothetical protein